MTSRSMLTPVLAAPLVGLTFVARAQRPGSDAAAESPWAARCARASSARMGNDRPFDTGGTMPKKIYVGNLPFSAKTSRAELEKISRRSKIPLGRLQELAAGNVQPTREELKALNVNEA